MGKGGVAFGDRLDGSLVDKWRDHYISYDKLKQLIDRLESMIDDTSYAASVRRDPSVEGGVSIQLPGEQTSLIGTPAGGPGGSSSVPKPFSSYKRSSSWKDLFQASCDTTAARRPHSLPTAVLVARRGDVL